MEGYGTVDLMGWKRLSRPHDKMNRLERTGPGKRDRLGRRIINAGKVKHLTCRRVLQDPRYSLPTGWMKFQSGVPPCFRAAYHPHRPCATLGCKAVRCFVHTVERKSVVSVSRG